MLLNFDHLKTFYNALTQKVKSCRGNWNQNDPTADDYIKNRTHYDFCEEVTLVDLSIDNFDEDNMPKCNFVPGQAYTVILNGVRYDNVICWSDGNYNILGDDGIHDFYIDDDGGDSFYFDSGDYFESLVITTVSEIVKKLDPKYLPEEVALKSDIPFGEETTVVNEPLNITWDGNTEGLVSVGDMLYKVSDLVLTDEQIKSATLGNSFSEDQVCIGDYWDELVSDGLVSHGVVAFFEGIVHFIREDNTTFNGIVFPQKGIYFISINGRYVSSLTTTEPVEQTKTIIKTIDTKYLPESHQFGSEVGYETKTLQLNATSATGGNAADLEIAKAIYENPQDVVFFIGGWGDHTLEEVYTDGSDWDGDYRKWVAKHTASGTVYSNRTLKVYLGTGMIYFTNSVESGAPATVTVPVKTEVIKPIDPKYLPNSGGVKYVTISSTFDAAPSYSADATYAQIAEWLAAGMDVKCVMDQLVLGLVESFPPINGLMHAAVMNRHLFAVNQFGVQYCVSIDDDNYVDRWDERFIQPYAANAVPDATGENVTAAEFNALLTSLRDAEILRRN